MMKRKHLSDIANHVLHGCARELHTSVDSMVEEFEASWKPEMGDYSRKLVEFCCSKAICSMCSNIEQMISSGSFSRFTFDMMLAWQMHSSDQEESYTESVAKEKEEKRMTIGATHEQDEIPLFYSDLMPLLVDHEPSVKEDAFVWFGTLVPLVVDMVNGRFTFETLTAPTANQLSFPAYDKYLKEIDKCMKQLRKQATPKGVELADDEFILHVEGTISTQRVVRHIGGTSWPGRLSLTNYALYFEASGVLSYEDALKLDLSKDTEQRVKPAATGPWGAPLFDKAIVYESTDLQEAVVLEFPEITSSTRRDHWLALVKEVMLLHQFLSKYKLESPTQAWEMHSRTILGVIRLHAAREMLRISPPDPKSFLIFALFDELPKGDYVLDELAENLKKVDSGHPCNASSILRCMNVSQQVAFNLETEKGSEQMTTVRGQAEDISSLESAINQVREEAKEIDMAKATAEGLKDEGISDSIFVLMELLKPLKNVGPWCQEILRWETPLTTIIVITISLLTIYKEWVGKALAACLLWVVGKMLWARKERIGEKCNKVVVCTATDQTTMESIVSAQYGLNTVHALVQWTNISILKIWSIFVSRAPKQANMVMMAMTGTAILLAVVPMKFILMALVLYGFTITRNMGKHVANANNNNNNSSSSSQGNRRLKEWWDSIPVVPIEVVDQIPAETQT
ncbi:uncharacterized protein LOC127806321 [Diospyros lotus]|uniref:uncharacterized protein LOC127806321 n=1 Tax=Diospyros lotus TaxID=55363 RepID=UPI0022569DE2|nr:uncharacterized protein LOC127806321 [Diospyros lotus]